MTGATAEPSLRQRLLAGGAWVVAGKVVTAASALLANALLARLLAPEALGAYFLVFSVTSFFAVVAQMGLSQAIVRLVAESLATQRPGRAARAVRLACRLTAASTAVIAVLLGAGLAAAIAEHFFSSALMAGVAGFTALWVIVQTFQRVLSEAFRGYHDIRMATLLGGTLTAVLTALLFAGLWLLRDDGAGLRTVLSLAIAAGAANAILAGILIAPRTHSAGEGGLAARELVQVALPLWITNIMVLGLTQADLWIIGLFLTERDVAVYGAVTRLIASIVTPLLLVNNVISPYIAQLHATGQRDKLEKMLRTAATLATLPAVAILIVFAFFGEQILELVYGEFYGAGATALLILAAGQVVNVAAGSCGLTLIMTGHQTLAMAITIATGALAVGGALLAVERFGIEGVAVAVAGALAIQNMAMIIFTKVNTGVWTFIEPKFFLLRIG